MVYPYQTMSFLGRFGSLRSAPPSLAIAAFVHGYTEDEVRQLIREGGDGSKEEEWISEMRNIGCFGGASTTASLVEDDEEVSDARSSREEGVDAGTLLWNRLLKALEEDEADFKHRIAIVDACIKNNGYFSDEDLGELNTKTARQHIPFSPYGISEDSFPWNGCKFVNMAVLHLISKPDAESKRNAVRSVSRSLGGFQLPSSGKVARTRWPGKLSEVMSLAMDKAREAGICTAVQVNLTDVEIMRNPSKGLFRTRPGTYAHNFVSTISPDGVYFYQGYGPRGYTLLQNMQSHNVDGEGTRYPLSFEDAKVWLQHFEDLAYEASGKWTVEVNAAYKFCFDVDLAKLGCMKIGNQLDLYYKVDIIEFDVDRIEKNFALLPAKSPSKYPPCKDGDIAKAASPPPEYTPDGGVPHYYTPELKCCVRCGKEPVSVKRCAKCRKVTYCSKECQVADWKQRHKYACKHLRK